MFFVRVGRLKSSKTVRSRGFIRLFWRPGSKLTSASDAIFPVLPRWFTTPLTADPSRRTPSYDSSATMVPSRNCFDHLPHDHALLEKLYKLVFHNRFLNPTPSCQYAPAYGIFLMLTDSPQPSFPTSSLPHFGTSYPLPFSIFTCLRSPRYHLYPLSLSPSSSNARGSRATPRKHLKALPVRPAHTRTLQIRRVRRLRRRRRAWSRIAYSE